MDDLKNFTKVSALICEPVRLKMLWSLLDGKAYTASELAAFADTSHSSASNHLSKLLDAELLKVEIQGRHRYYTFANNGIAYAVESLAQLSKVETSPSNLPPTGVKYCRTCYDHIAGFVGVQLVNAMKLQGFIKERAQAYLVTPKGWTWLENFDIREKNYKDTRRPLTRQCLDWSERRPHLAGQLGADLLSYMLTKKWLKKVQFSRELIVTREGSQKIYELFGCSL